MSADSSIRFREWQRGTHAVRYERAQGEGRSTRLAIHPSAPFVAEITTSNPDRLTLAGIAHRYLETLDQHLESAGEGGLAFPAHWLDALSPKRKRSDARPLRWLNIWPSRDEPCVSRLASWRLIRHVEGAPADEDDGDEPKKSTKTTKAAREAADETIVMTAAEVLHRTDHWQIATLAYGVRVPITLTRQAGAVTATIRSMTAELPAAPYRSVTEVMALTGGLDIFGRIGDLKHLIARLISPKTGRQLAERLGLRSVAYDDVRFRWNEDAEAPELESIEVRGKGLGELERPGRALPYAFTAEFADTDGKPDGQFEFVRARRRRLSAAGHDDGMADVFAQEPPFGVTSSEEVLQRFRVPMRIGRKKDVALTTRNFRVRNCPRFVRTDPTVTAAATDVKTVRLPSGVCPPVRANDFSAISAFVNCRRFFQLIHGAGIRLDTFTVAAQRQIQVFYRSGFRPGAGKDGQTINARVWIEPSADGQAAGPPEIQLHLALANFTHRARPIAKPAKPGMMPAPTWAEPLGIAASDRWMWHEFGHVLLAARFGELEFAFAHSPGDGMAAVYADPFSRLADPRNGVDKRFRGITFPWVLATRRHDRSVRLGWAWNGTLNRSLLSAPFAQKTKPKGYITEQILSSTLFRLYRVLGGDSVMADEAPNVALRERASLLTLFLLIQAVRSMAQRPSRAETLEAAMEEADMALTRLRFQPFRPQGPLKHDADDAWVGGSAHKVVRWAFEAQGMFAPDPSENHDAPGMPPLVDIYLPDQRLSEKNTDGNVAYHGPGSYVPVSLDWDRDRLWQAGPIPSTSRSRITLGNRGTAKATGVRLRGWWGIVTDKRGTKGWDMSRCIDWQSAFNSPQTTADIASDGTIAVEIAELAKKPTVPNGKFLVLLIEASCADDRANSDPATMLATAIPPKGDPPKRPRQLADLVANDNNLALWQS